jgi:hypothetical protein
LLHDVVHLEVHHISPVQRKVVDLAGASQPPDEVDRRDRVGLALQTANGVKASAGVGVSGCGDRGGRGRLG